MKPILKHEIIARIFIDQANLFHRTITKLIKTTFRKEALGTLELELLVSMKWEDIVSYEDRQGTETIFVEITEMFTGEVLFHPEAGMHFTIPAKDFNESYIKYKLQLS